MNDKTIAKEYISEGIKVTEYSDGTTNFKPLDEESKVNHQPDERSWWQKLRDWWKDSPVKPYAKVRDLSDPFNELKKNPDIHDDSGSKMAVEVGVKVEF